MGNNQFGQLGLDNKVQYFLTQVQSRFFPTLIKVRNEDKKFYHVAAGAYHSLSIAEGGTEVFSWGRNDQGQLGLSNSVNQYSPVDISDKFESNTSNAELVCGGENHSALIFGDGEVWTWGANNFGQVGRGTENQVEEDPAPLDCFDEDVVAVACGKNQTLFLTQNRRLYAAGNNDEDQLGVDVEVDLIVIPEEILHIKEKVRI